MSTAKEKKEEVKASLKILRAELRKMHLGVTEELALPEPTEVKKLMTQMEELLVVIEPKSTRKAKKLKWLISLFKQTRDNLKLLNINNMLVSIFSIIYCF